MKPSKSELLNALRQCKQILERLEIPYHLTGGLVSTYYGDPRFTQDIDFVIRLSIEQVKSLAHALQQVFSLDRASMDEAVAVNGLFQALTPATFIKIDFHVGEEIPDELERSERAELAPGLAVNIPSIEDAITSKLHWIRLGSHKSRGDVVGMLNSEHEINHEQLLALCTQMGLDDLLEEMKVAAQSPDQAEPFDRS